jgi:hypothetical protein
VHIGLVEQRVRRRRHVGPVLEPVERVGLEVAAQRCVPFGVHGDGLAERFGLERFVLAGLVVVVAEQLAEDMVSEHGVDDRLGPAPGI